MRILGDFFLPLLPHHQYADNPDVLYCQKGGGQICVTKTRCLLLFFSEMLSAACCFDIFFYKQVAHLR